MIYSNVIDAEQLFNLKRFKTIADRPKGKVACHPETYESLKDILSDYDVIKDENLERGRLYAMDMDQIMPKFRPPKFKPPIRGDLTFSRLKLKDYTTSWIVY